MVTQNVGRVGERGQRNQEGRKESRRKNARPREGQGRGGERGEDAFSCLGEEKRNRQRAHPALTPARLRSNFPDVTAATASWFWSLSIPRGTAVIPDHASVPESQCHPLNIPWDRAGMGTICPCQEMWADLPTQQPSRRGCAEARWHLVKGNLRTVLTTAVEAGFAKRRSQGTWVPTAALPRGGSVTWGKSPLVSEPLFPHLKREGLGLCGLHSLIVSLGAK